MHDGGEAALNFQQACKKLAMTQSQLENTQRDAGESWKLEYVRLRREMAIQLGKVYEGMQKLNVPPSSYDAYAKLREAFSQMRSTVALHQASWPAVIIKHDDPEYLTSIKKVRQSNQVFNSALEAFSKL